MFFTSICSYHQIWLNHLMDVSTLELRAKSQNWKKKEKSSVHKQLVDDGWKTTEIHTLYETFGGFGYKFFPSVASTADAFILVQIVTNENYAKLGEMVPI